MGGRTGLLAEGRSRTLTADHAGIRALLLLLLVRPATRLHRDLAVGATQLIGQLVLECEHILQRLGQDQHIGFAVITAGAAVVRVVADVEVAVGAVMWAEIRLALMQLMLMMVADAGRLAKRISSRHRNGDDVIVAQAGNAGAAARRSRIGHYWSVCLLQPKKKQYLT